MSALEGRRVLVVGPTVTGIADEWDPELAMELMAAWAADGIRHDEIMVPDDVAREVVDVLASPVRVSDVVVQGRPS